MILVLNCGSQSIKWKLFDTDLKTAKEGKADVFDVKNYENLLRDELLKIKSSDITAIGHRVVHGGSIFSAPVKISEDFFSKIEKMNRFAPLHNPYNILGIKACQGMFSSVPQIAVFDTEFFKDLPEVSYTYALPENIVQEFGFRRYGFHGTSHEYAAKEAAKKVKKPLEKLKIITCHLGGGSSIAAIKNAKAVDTSMGFTPQEGVVMMTRPGNMDSGVVLELVREFTLDKTNEILNKESGIRGICGESDMLKVLEKIEQGDEKSKLALDVFVYSLQKYIGSYFAVLDGCDILVFTGLIGSGSAKIRDMACKDLNILKKTKVLAIETDEELAIAQKVLNIKY